MRTTLTTIIILLAAALSAAPALVVDAPDSLRVGQRFTAEVAFETTEDQPVTPPPLGPYGEFELIDIEERKRGGETSYVLTLAPFEADDPIIPALPFTIGGKTAYTQPTPIAVLSALTPITTLADIADPAPVRPGALDIALPLAVLGLLAYAFWRVRRKLADQEAETFAPVDNRPAWVVALEMLAELRGSGSLERDDMLSWYFGLSLVTRTFLERFTGVSAVEMTTSEIAAALPELPQRQRIIEFLRKADGIKFAKQQPPSGEASAAADWLETYLHMFEKADGAKEADHA